MLGAAAPASAMALMPRGDEDALDRPGAGDRGGERELARVVERRHGMAAEPREHAAPGRRIAVRSELGDLRPRREKESLASASPEHGGKERDLPFAVDRRDDRQRLHAEAVKGPAAWRRLSGDGHAADA